MYAHHFIDPAVNSFINWSRALTLHSTWPFIVSGNVESRKDGRPFGRLPSTSMIILSFHQRELCVYHRRGLSRYFFTIGATPSITNTFLRNAFENISEIFRNGDANMILNVWPTKIENLIPIFTAFVFYIAAFRTIDLRVPRLFNLIYLRSDAVHAPRTFAHCATRLAFLRGFTINRGSVF